MTSVQITFIRPLRFGPWAAPTEPTPLGGGLNVIVGANEAGKSSLVALIRAALYGFQPASRDRYPWVPLGDERAELEVDLEIASQPLTIRRRLLSQPQGQVLRSRGSEQLRNAPLPEVAHVPDEVFGAVYALDLAALTPPGGRAWTAIEERLLAGEVDPGIRPAALVLEELDAELAALGEARGRRRWGAIGKATERRDGLRSALQAAGQGENRLKGVAVELAGLEERLAAVDGEARAARDSRPAQQARLNALVAAETRAQALDRDLAGTLAEFAAAEQRFQAQAAGLIAPGARPADLPAAGTLSALANRLRAAERELEVSSRLAGAPLPGGASYLAVVLLAVIGLIGLLLLPSPAGQFLAGGALASAAVLAWLSRPRAGATALADAAGDLRQVRDQIARTLAGAGVAHQVDQGATGEVLESLAGAAEEARRMDQAAARAATLRGQLAGLAAEHGAPPVAASESAPAYLAQSRLACQEELRAADAGLETLLGERDRLLDRRRELLAEQDSLLAANPVDRLTGELQTAEQELQRFKLLQERLETLKQIVRDAQRRHRERFEPAVFRRTGDLLRRLTKGRYVRLATGAEPTFDRPGDLGLEGPGRTVPLDRLSRGTRDQLLLALRLAVAEEFDAGGARLPLILDEPLVNWDAERRREGLALLAELAAGRQIILLTTHQWLAGEAVAAGARTVSLPPG